MLAKHSVDAYIREREIEGPDKYAMDLYYDGIKFDELNKSYAYTKDFASHFKKRIPCEVDMMIYSNYSGLLSEKDNTHSVLARVIGLDNIDKSIIALLYTSTNLDIQSDLTVHLNDKDYPLVRTVDYENYRTPDRCSLKGYSTDIWRSIINDIHELKTDNNIKRR